VRVKSPSLLTGLLFDAEGQRMTPTHAVKNNRRYRYYVSRPLIVGAAAPVPGFAPQDSWRFASKPDG
jgi:hypothetical protein